MLMHCGTSNTFLAKATLPSSLVPQHTRDPSVSSYKLLAERLCGIVTPLFVSVDTATVAEPSGSGRDGDARDCSAQLTTSA